MDDKRRKKTNIPWPTAIAASFTTLAVISLLQNYPLFNPTIDSRSFEMDANTPGLSNNILSDDGDRQPEDSSIAHQKAAKVFGFGSSSPTETRQPKTSSARLEGELNNQVQMPKPKTPKKLLEKSKLLGNLAISSLPEIDAGLVSTEDSRLSERKRAKSDSDGLNLASDSTKANSKLERIVASGVLADSTESFTRPHKDSAVPHRPKIKYTPQLLAQRYLSNLRSTDNLRFQDASGYWANTYIPGDPSFRLIKSRLKQWDRSKMSSLLITDTNIENAMQQNRQTFDAPKNAALAVYLHADKNHLSSPSRLRLQVGIQATDRFSGVRPNMNIGVVLDSNLYAKGNNVGTVKKLSALLKALAKFLQPGDRFSLTVSGQGGGTWIAPGEFRHGTVQVVINKLLIQHSQSSNESPTLLDAYVSAADLLHKEDNPTATLGSSMLMLISDLPWSPYIDGLANQAQLNAVNGITTSVVSINNSNTHGNVEKIVLKGQGHRRLLSRAKDAKTLIQRELLSSSRAIARAVRIRIRLAPGVKLIEVIDSYRLDSASAQHVRDAEQSLDQHSNCDYRVKKMLKSCRQQILFLAKKIMLPRQQSTFR